MLNNLPPLMQSLSLYIIMLLLFVKSSFNISPLSLSLYCLPSTASYSSYASSSCIIRSFLFKPAPGVELCILGY